ncbi:MAG TPA: hypothetical protein DEO70_12265 [Bacteroidales bacterium]|nr:MAG: hypothetical protein A2X11_10260 [Bacteroidetes bacterium GWE2_42_24]OFY25893.1 MAG: hypothetical protein A2X09_09635 [Bacteroidetes bacterium GWF2_43_11]HBZ67603.1 hypothetical protein [Bacteroidales bacterium]
MKIKPINPLLLKAAFWFILISISFSDTLQAQSNSFCATPPTGAYPELEDVLKTTVAEGPFYLKIYVHVVRRDDGTGGQSVENVLQALSILDQDFNPYSIYFIWDCSIHYIDSTILYNFPYSGRVFLTPRNKTGINIYLFGDESYTYNPGEGRTDSIGGNAFYIFGKVKSPYSNPLVRSHVISHEMGHCLNLWHPWEGPNNLCYEWPNGNYCEECGDELCSTPAEPVNGCNQDIDTNDCSWLYPVEFSPGWFYKPDTTLFMGYTHPKCMSTFTDEQLQRMYNSIVTLPVLQACVVPDPNHIISGTVAWNTPIEVAGDVIIEPGGQLTITDEVAFYPKSKIIVKPGGKLFVNRGTLTNLPSCRPGHPWQGIEVWGNSAANQYPDANGNYNQGYLMLNNATIENAVCAVDLWKPNDFSKTGGILKATNSHFINNTKSIHAGYYTNKHPINGKPTTNIGYAVNCTFVINQGYNASKTFYKHADLAQLNGFSFSGCDFSLAQGVDGVSPWNIAIGSYDAAFSVTAPCSGDMSPCNEYDRNTFTGFYAAVYATKTPDYNTTFDVIRSDFSNNAIGIYINGVKNEAILFCNFHLGSNAGDDCGVGLSPSYGIDMTGSTGFVIEENTFQRADGTAPGDYTGIRATQCLSIVDDIYKNSYIGLERANLAQDLNRADYSNGATGISYLCNQNRFNRLDIHVTGNQASIRGNLGGLEVASGNTLTDPAFAEAHILNQGVQDVNYYFYQPNENERLIEYSTYVYPYPLTISQTRNECLSHYGGSTGGNTTEGLVLDAAGMQQKADEYSQYVSDYNTVASLYQQLTDGGSTETTKTVIETSQPDDMWILRDDLLGKSPYLSQEVLMVAADKTDVLPEAVLFEILAANPDELRRQELIDYLRNKPDPLPEYMIELLEILARGETGKTALLNQMARYYNGKVQAVNTIVRSLLRDTITDYGQVRTWLTNLGGIESGKQVVGTYLAEANYTTALGLLDSMAADYSLSGVDLEHFNEYRDITGMLISLRQNGLDYNNLDSASIAQLVDFADNSTGEARYLAQNILSQAFGLHYCNCPPQPGTITLKASKPVNPVLLAEAHGLTIGVAPNPASTWAAFNYVLAPGETNGLITISDNRGNTITTIPVTDNRGQKVWDTRQVSSGMYIYTLTCNGMSRTGKLVIK